MAVRFPISSVAWIALAALAMLAGCGRSDESGQPEEQATQASQAPHTPINSASSPQNKPPQAAAILQAAIQSLENRQSVSAKIRQQVNLFDQQLVGSGDYFQQRTEAEPLIRLELRIQVGDQASSLLQVASPPTQAGRFLWTSRKMPEEETLTRLDLSHVARVLRDSGSPRFEGGDGILAGPGGLPRLLHQLQAAMDFTSAETGLFGQTTVWRLQGGWKPQRLAQMLPEQKAPIEAGNPADLTKLPEHVPDRVILLLGHGDLFPRRIEYRRTVSDDTNSDDTKRARSSGQQGSGRALVTLELYEIRFDRPIDQARFIYDPGDADFSDVTDAYLDTLGVVP